MQAKVQLKGSIFILLIVLVALGVRVSLFADSRDPALHEAVRSVIWSAYSGTSLNAEISAMRDSGDFDNVDDLMAKATPDVIDIVQISRSQPLFSQSTNQKVVVRVRYHLPESTERQTRYMKFMRGSLGNVWRYENDSSVVSYYLNFF